MYRLCSRLLVFLAVVCLPAYSTSPELERHLKDQYQGKIFLLRDFPSGPKLHYDASGSLTGNGVPGTWTIDGFVLIEEAGVDGPNLVINGRRMPVVSLGGFQFAADSPKKRKKAPKIHIDAEIVRGAGLPEVDVLLAKIFLTDSESLLASVPSYWRTCVAAGLNKVNDPKYAGCRLSPDMLAVRGANAHANSYAIAQRSESEQSSIRDNARSRARKGRIASGGYLCSRTEIPRCSSRYRFSARQRHNP